MKQLQEIMSAIGRKRFVLLVILAAICLGLAGIWQKVLLPQHQQLSAELTQVQSARNQLRTEINELPGKHAILEANENRYTTLRDRGFFLNQDRIEARARMIILRQEADIYGITYKIEPIEQLEDNSFVSETDQIVMSKIEVELRSVTDLEALDFVERMQQEFSGLVVLKELTLERADDAVSPENLQKLSKGEAVELVKGKASFDWYSIIPKASTVSTPLSQAFEGSSQ